MLAPLIILHMAMILPSAFSDYFRRMVSGLNNAGKTLGKVA
jgi:hypothetical protein